MSVPVRRCAASVKQPARRCAPRLTATLIAEEEPRGDGDELDDLRHRPLAAHLAVAQRDKVALALP